jgi:hypothetical protein
MKITDIIKAIYFPASKITHSEDILVGFVLRAIQKDWKIKILILHKQQDHPFSFQDLKELEGKSLSGLLKKESIAVEEIPQAIYLPLLKDIKKLINHYDLTKNQDLFRKAQHHLTKSIAQELLDHTTKKRVSVTLEHTLMGYLPIPFAAGQAKEFYFIPKNKYTDCLKCCHKIIKSAVSPNFIF